MLKEKTKRWRVPASLISSILTVELGKLGGKKARQLAEAKAYKEELEDGAIPALRAHYERLVTAWEALPPGKKRRTRKPLLDDAGFIIVYEEATFLRTIDQLLSRGPGFRERWFEKEYIRVKDVYTFRNSLDHSYDSFLDREVTRIKQEIAALDGGEGYVWLTACEAAKLGISREELAKLEWEIW